MERKRHLKIGISSYTDTHTVLGVTGNAEFSGIVTALEFHGDGSNLTNITADAGSYATSAGFATVAGYAHTAGFSTTSNYATTAGSATNATNAGSANTATAAATAYSLTGRPDIEINNLDVAGISTLDNNLNVSSLLTVDVTNNKIGFNTNSPESFFEVRRDQFVARESVMLVSDGGVSQPSGVDCTLRVANDGSLPSYSVLELESDTSNFIFRNDGLTGIGTTQPSTTLDVRGTLSISGVSTFKSTVSVNDNVTIALGAGTTGGALQLFQTGPSGTGRIRNRVGDLEIQEDSGSIVFKKGITAEKLAEFATDGAVDLYYDGAKKFETTQSGIIVTGIATADGFVGPLEGNVTGDLTGDVNAGVITAVTGNFTGNVTIGGTLTYEDVTNVDSIGIVTARDGIVVNTRGIHVLSGITTLQDLDAQDLNIRNITGVAATFTDSVSLYDNDRIFLGTSQEMEIFHGTLGNSFFTSTKPLYIKYGEDGQTHEMFIQNDSTTSAKFTDDASVELYYNGGKRLETVGGGVTVTGDLRVSGVVTATRFESTSSGTPSIDSPNNLDLNAINVAVSTDMSVGRNLTVVGFVSAANFYGDGSGLTNLPSQSYVGNAGVATYAQTAGIATLAENLTGSPDITISSATVGSTLTIQASNIYRSNADLTLTGGGPQSTRSQLILSNGQSATLKANDNSGSVVLKAPVGSVQVLDVGVTTSTPFLRTGAAGTVRLDRGDGNFTGVVTATTFYGDFQGNGSGITGITATYANTAGVSTVAEGLTGTPDIEVSNLNASGVSTFSKISVGNTTGTDGQYLKSTGVGVTWADFPVVRTGLSTVATSGQTGFTTSYNVGFVDVYVNGIRLTNSEFTATDGSNIGLTTACFGGEYVDIIAYNTISAGTGGGGGGGGGSSATRSSATLTIGSIASGVTTTGTVTLPKSGVMISIHPVGIASGWLRLYTRSDLASSDASRTRTEDPSSGSGVILETITSGINTVYLSPQTIFANAEDTPINTFNYRFTKDGSAGITTFTFKYLSLEP